MEQPNPKIDDALSGDTMTPDFDQTRDAALAFTQQANSVVAQHLQRVGGNGSAGPYMKQAMKATRPKSEAMVEDALSTEKDFEPPVFPGSVYLNHLFKRTKHKAKEAREKNKGRTNDSDQVNIYTDQNEALKTAIQILGLYSDRNPGGMPFDVKDIKKIWFGGDADLDKVKEAEWRSLVEMGDRNLDPKKIRKFVNYDGSTTWEILNEDKTVSSRFTLGELNGMQVFAQGGYTKFAQVLKKAQQKQGSAGQFGALRNQFSGG